MTEERPGYLADAEAMMGKGYEPVVQFERPSDQLVETEGGYELVKSLGWVKFSAEFRKRMLRELKGAKLSIFMCICLHLNENGESFPGIDKIAEETGYHRETVMNEIAEMEKMNGLLQVLRERGKVNHYKPSFAARGANNEPEVPVGKIRLVGQPVDKTSTTLPKTSPENLDSKESKETKEIATTSPPSANGKKKDGVDWVLDQMLPTMTRKQAIADYFKLNVNWDTRTAKQWLQWAQGEKITVEQIRRAADTWRSDKKFNWRAPNLQAIFENWKLLTEGSVQEPLRML